MLFLGWTEKVADLPFCEYSIGKYYATPLEHLQFGYSLLTEDGYSGWALIQQALVRKFASFVVTRMFVVRFCTFYILSRGTR